MNGATPPAGVSAAGPLEAIRAQVGRAFDGIAWRIRWATAHIIEGDRSWGRLRLLALACLVVASAAVAFRAELVPPAEAILLPPQPAPNAPPADLLLWLFKLVAAFVLSPPARRLWRHLIPAILGWQLAFHYGRMFLDDLFELGDPELAKRYLSAALFGQKYPSMTIAEGQIAPADQKGPVARIGGPGRVTLQPGNAALFERLAWPTAVLGAGTHFLGRFETLREVVDLRDQFRSREEVKAMTKDGIPVVVRNIQAQFRFRTGGKPRTEQEPFPFLRGAVQRAVYGKSVGAKGPTPWADAVLGDVATQITNWIKERQVDDLTAPGKEADPRQQLHDHFQTAGVRGVFKGKGAEILWVSIGHIQPDERVLKQRMDTWSASSAVNDQVTRAEGEAYAVQLAELARAQVQAIIITAITNALTSIDPRLSSVPAEIMVRRVGELLAQMAARPVELAVSTPFQDATSVQSILAELIGQLAAQPAPAPPDPPPTRAA